MCNGKVVREQFMPGMSQMSRDEMTWYANVTFVWNEWKNGHVNDHVDLYPLISPPVWKDFTRTKETLQMTSWKFGNLTFTLSEWKFCSILRNLWFGSMHDSWYLILIWCGVRFYCIMFKVWCDGFNHLWSVSGFEDAILKQYPAFYKEWNFSPSPISIIFILIQNIRRLKFQRATC